MATAAKPMRKTCEEELNEELKEAFEKFEKFEEELKEAFEKFEKFEEALKEAFKKFNETLNKWPTINDHWAWQKIIARKTNEYKRALKEPRLELLELDEREAEIEEFKKLYAKEWKRMKEEHRIEKINEVNRLMCDRLMWNMCYNLEVLGLAKTFYKFQNELKEDVKAFKTAFHKFKEAFEKFYMASRQDSYSVRQQIIGLKIYFMERTLYELLELIKLNNLERFIDETHVYG